MALSITRETGDVQDVHGRYKSVRVILDNTSYAAGGVALTDTHLKSLGLRKCVAVVFDSPLSDTGSVWRFDPSVPEFLVYEGDNDNAADAPLVECDNSDDCGAVRATIVGY